MNLFKNLFLTMLLASFSVPMFAMDMELSEDRVTRGPHDFSLTAEQKAEFALLFQQGEAVVLPIFQTMIQVCPATRAYVYSLDCIFTAIDYDFGAMIKWLHSRGVNLNQQAAGDLNTPLMYAVLIGRPDMVLIISQLPDINLDAQDFQGDTALHHASLKQDVLSWNWLVMAGASVIIPNFTGEFPRKVELRLPPYLS